MSEIPAVTREPILQVDATPDEEYAVRILRAHRANCDVLWADNAVGAEPTDPLLVAMNEAQRQRAALLDQAIARLTGNAIVLTSDEARQVREALIWADAARGTRRSRSARVSAALALLDAKRGGS